MKNHGMRDPTLRDRKLRHLFRLNDRDGDGFISHDDLLRQCDEYASLRGWQAHAPLASGHRAALEGIWGLYLSAANPHDGDRVSLDAWMRFWGSYIAVVEAELAAGDTRTLDAMMSGVRQLFVLFDDRGTGRADAARWCEHAASLGIADPEAAFERIDPMGFGSLTPDDCVRLQTEFLLSDDTAAPGNHYFGVIDGI